MTLGMPSAKFGENLTILFKKMMKMYQFGPKLGPQPDFWGPLPRRNRYKVDLERRKVDVSAIREYCREIPSNTPTLLRSRLPETAEKPEEEFEVKSEVTKTEPADESGKSSKKALILRFDFCSK